MLVEAIINGKELNKETVRTDEIQHYVISKVATINQELRKNKSLLDLEDEDDYVDVLQVAKEKSKREPKKVKRSTFEITLEMVQNGKNAAEIARERQLSKTTINGHFAKLIQSEQLELSHVMDEKRIRVLEAYFDDYEGGSLTPLKEKLGDKVTWDELKLIQASKMI